MSLLLLQKRRAMMKQFAWNTMTGTGSLTLLNGLKASFKELKLIGNSVQGYTVKVLSGELEQGTISIVDGMNVTSNYRVRTKGFLDIEKGKYKVTCEGAKQGNVIFCDKNGTFQKALFDVHTVFPFVLTVEEACKIKVVVSNGTEAEQIAITPNNVKSIAVATEISPEYRQEVKSVGRKSRNLFDISKYDKYDDTWTNTTYTTKKLKLKPNTMYTMSCKRLVDKPKQYVIFNIISGIKTGDGIRMQINTDLSLNTFNPKGTFITDETGEITLNYYVDTSKDKYWFTEVIGDIQIELGSNQTDYEQYTDKKLIDIQVIGKNLFDVSKIQRGYYLGGNGELLKIDEGYCVSDYIDITDEEVKICVNPLSKSYASFVVFFDENKKKIINYANTVVSERGGLLNIPKGAKYVRFSSRNIESVQVEYGEKATDYEPYKEPQTTQIALDEPLRGIGNYKDVIAKNGIVRKVKEIVLDNTTEFQKYTGGTQEKTVAFITNVINDASNINFTNNALSDRFVKVTSFDGSDFECFSLYKQRILIRVDKQKGITNIEELKTWLSENPVTVQYVLKEPTTELLQTELGNLHTYNGTTCIYTDSGEVQTGIEATYKSNRREKNE